MQSTIYKWERVSSWKKLNIHVFNVIIKQQLRVAFQIYWEQCEYKAVTKEGIKVHINGVHDNLKYSCEQCIYKATTKLSLKVHSDVVHLIKTTLWLYLNI